MEKQNKHILIVDDLPEHLTFAGAILKQQGYKVHIASSGKATLKFLENHHPDLIVLDIYMDDINGLELCRIIKSNTKTQDIPVIFVTAETNPDIINQGFEAGCCDYVSKPFMRVEYLARINAHLRIAGQAKELSQAYEELDRFCSAVSHDLRSPLGVIKMLLSVLRDEIGDNLNDEAMKIMGMLDDKAQHLNEMVGKLLEFSRMCNIKSSFQMVDLKNIIDEIFKEEKLAEPDRKITLICDKITSVNADPVLVKLLFNNVLQNAFKFTSKCEHAIISINCFDEDNYTVIEIKDNGVGFDMKYCDKLFGIFQRLHSQSEFKGTGVGLAMVNRIMQRHGGFIRMTGEVNKGAQVFLYFPNI